MLHLAFGKPIPHNFRIASNSTEAANNSERAIRCGCFFGICFFGIGDFSYAAVCDQRAGLFVFRHL